ncbi:MAG: SAF domain-containing protein [Acidimicrobiales bacterium]
MQRVAKIMDTSPVRPAAAAEGAGRTIRPGRPLPSGRAVLGALLVTVAALAAFLTARSADDQPSTSYLVATRALAPGQILSPADMASVVMELPPSQATSAFSGAQADAVVGSAARGPVAQGALLTDAVLEPPVEGARAANTTAEYREISFAVPRARALLGNLVPGDRVDVVASEETASVVLVQQALVVAVSSGADDALVLSEDVVITLALSGADEALAVAHGAAANELTVLRSTRARDRLADRFPIVTSPVAPTAASTAASGLSPTTTSPAAGVSR